MDRGAWEATVHGVSQSRTELSAHACTHTHVSTCVRMMACKGQRVTGGSHPQRLPWNEGPCSLPFHGMVDKR